MNRTKISTMDLKTAQAELARQNSPFGKPDRAVTRWLEERITLLKKDLGTSIVEYKEPKAGRGQIFTKLPK